MKIQEKIVKFLRWSEKYIETDMVYAVKGSFWIIFGKIGIFAISFAKMIAFGRYAGQEVYGTYTFILSMAVMFEIFSLPGVNTSLVKAIAQKKEGTLSLAIKEKLKFSLFASLLSLITAGWYFYSQNNVLAIAFLGVAILIPFQSVFSIFFYFWTGRKNFQKANKYALASAFLVALIVIPVITITNNPALIIIVLFASQSFFNGIFLVKTLRQKKNKEIMPESISFGKNLTTINGIVSFTNQIDKIILWKFFGAIPLAIYSFAEFPIMKIQEMIPITYLALPKIGEKKTKEIKQGILKKFKKLFFLFIPLTALLIIIAPYFYKLILPQYIESVPYFQVFALLLIFSPFLLLNASLVSEMKKKELYVIQTITPFSRIILFLILIPFFQVWGVIYSILISKAINGIIVLHFFKKI
jgi:O-antigen/teichoic acid export membrane protein